MIADDQQIVRPVVYGATKLYTQRFQPPFFSFLVVVILGDHDGSLLLGRALRLLLRLVGAPVLRDGVRRRAVVGGQEGRLLRVAPVLLVAVVPADRRPGHVLQLDVPPARLHPLQAGHQVEEAFPERGREVGVEDRVDARVEVGQHVGGDLYGDGGHGEGVQAEGPEEEDELDREPGGGEDEDDDHDELDHALLVLDRLCAGPPTGRLNY